MRQFAVALLVYQQQGIVVLTKVAGPMLPTSSGTPLRKRFAVAWASKSWLSAAKPTQYNAPDWARGRLGHAGQDVGVLHKIQRRGWPEPSFLIFRWTGLPRASPQRPQLL